MSALAPTLEAFFTERLIGQRHASPNTVAAYRDAWLLLLRFLRDRTGKEPCQLDLVDLDATVIGAFLDHLEPGAATAPAPATPAWPPSARSSTTPRSATPSTPASSPGC
jgi:hypothetical protein